MQCIKRSHSHMSSHCWCFTAVVFIFILRLWFFHSNWLVLSNFCFVYLDMANGCVYDEFAFFLVVLVVVETRFRMTYKRWCENSVYMNFGFCYYGPPESKFIQIKNMEISSNFVFFFFLYRIWREKLCMCSTWGGKKLRTRTIKVLKRKLLSNAFHFYNIIGNQHIQNVITLQSVKVYKQIFLFSLCNSINTIWEMHADSFEQI